MGKYLIDGALDAKLAHIAACDRIDLVSDAATPENLNNSLAHASLTPGDGNGDFAIANGDSSGRKLTLATKSAVADGSGTALHIVLSLSGVIRFCTTCSKTIVNGAAYDIKCSSTGKVIEDADIS